MEKYPRLFPDGNCRCGFYVGEGWLKVLEPLCEILNYHIENQVPEELRPNIYVEQVKEKFGGLRFYMSNTTPFISGAISMAEAMCDNMCEDCGNPGVRRGGGWIKNLCDSCSAERDKKRK